MKGLVCAMALLLAQSPAQSPSESEPAAIIMRQDVSKMMSYAYACGQMESARTLLGYATQADVQSGLSRHAHGIINSAQATLASNRCDIVENLFK